MVGRVLLPAVLGWALMSPTVAQEPEDVEQAREWIAAGENLERIDKQTWRELLTPEQYRVLWRAKTEPAHTGELLDEDRPGTYVTAGCRLPVFRSEHKYESGTGWPSFWEVAQPDNIRLEDDYSWYGHHRTEVVSACGEHLGHVFEDGPEPTGLRYCLNSAALIFIPDEQD